MSDLRIAMAAATAFAAVCGIGNAAASAAGSVRALFVDIHVPRR